MMYCKICSYIFIVFTLRDIWEFFTPKYLRIAEEHTIYQVSNHGQHKIKDPLTSQTYRV